MATHNVKNISTGIRGFHSVDGLVEIAPGKSAEGVEISTAEFNSMARTGWFEVDGKPDENAEGDVAQADDLDTTIPKLKEIAKLEDVDLNGMTSKGDIQGAIRLARTAKATKPAGSDAIDAMDDATLRSTVQALTAKPFDEVNELDRPALLALARGQ
jgi:hypothetical protein